MQNHLFLLFHCLLWVNAVISYKLRYHLDWQGNGPIRHVETCPDFFFHCKSIHNKIHCQNFSCWYALRVFFKNCRSYSFFLYAEPLVTELCTTLTTAVTRRTCLTLENKYEQVCITLLKNLICYNGHNAHTYIVCNTSFTFSTIYPQWGSSLFILYSLWHDENRYFLYTKHT
jgi:hypothetical protein